MNYLEETLEWLCIIMASFSIEEIEALQHYAPLLEMLDKGEDLGVLNPDAPTLLEQVNKEGDQ